MTNWILTSSGQGLDQLESPVADLIPNLQSYKCSETASPLLTQNLLDQSLEMDSELDWLLGARLNRRPSSS